MIRLLPFDYAVRNLGRSPRRLALTVGGACLVVLLVLVASGFTRGLERSIVQTGGEHNVIILGAGSEDSVERSEIEAGVPGLLAATLAGIREQAGVPFLSPEVHVMLPVGAERDDGRQVYVRGVTPAASLVHESVRIVDGRWPRPAAGEVMLGQLAPRVIGDGQVRLGSTIQIDGRSWTVVGRFAAPGTVLESEVWMPLSDLMEATRRDTLSCVVITLEPYDEATGAGAEFADVDALVRTRPDLELSALPEREYYAGLGAFYGPIRAVTLLTAGLIAAGGLLGGLNTTYAAFAARIRELASLQALGFRRLALCLSLVQEATLATAAGALIACAVAALLLDGLAVRFSMGAFGLVIDAPVIATGLSVGLLLGTVGALPPALRCLRPPIPDALRAV